MKYTQAISLLGLNRYMACTLLVLSSFHCFAYSNASSFYHQTLHFDEMAEHDFSMLKSSLPLALKFEMLNPNDVVVFEANEGSVDVSLSVWNGNRELVRRSRENDLYAGNEGFIISSSDCQHCEVRIEIIANVSLGRDFDLRVKKLNTMSDKRTLAIKSYLYEPDGKFGCGQCSDADAFLAAANDWIKQGNRASADDAMMRRALSLMKQGSFFQADATLAQFDKDSTRYALANVYRAVAHYRQGKLTAAERLLEKSVIAVGKKDWYLDAQVSYYRGLLELSRENFEKAKSYIKSALRTFEENNSLEGIIMSWNTLGVIGQFEGMYSSAFAHHEVARGMLPEMGMVTRQATTYYYLANVHLRLGNFDAALHSANTALASAEKGRDLFWVASAYNRRARVFSRFGFYDKAEADLLKSLAALNKFGSVSDISDTHFELAELYLDANLLDKASFHLQNVIYLEEKLGRQYDLAVARNSLAKIDIKREDLERARVQQNLALDIAKAIKNPYLIAKLSGQLAEIYFLDNDLSEAENILTLIRNLEKQHHDTLTVLKSRHLDARVQLRRGRVSDALDKYRKLVFMVERERRNINDLSMRRRFLKLQASIYYSYISTLNETSTHSTTLNKAPIRSTAILNETILNETPTHSTILNKTPIRSTAILNETPTHSTIPNETPTYSTVHLQTLGLADALHARTLLDENSKDLLSNADLGRLGLFSHAVSVKNIAQKLSKALVSQPENAKVLYAQMEKLSIDILQAVSSSPHYDESLPQWFVSEDFKKTLSPDELALVYLTGESNSWLWLVSSDSVRTKKLPPRQMLGLDINRALNLIGPMSNRDRALANVRTEQNNAMLHLAKLLFADQINYIAQFKRIVVVPDGPISLLPFSVLINPSTKESLLASHEVSYSPSLSVLRAIRQRQQKAPSSAGRYLVVADPLYDSKRSPRLGIAALPRLRFSLREARAITALVPKANVLMGEYASKANILSQNPENFSVLHFAAHGLSSDKDASLSSLFFAMSKGLPDGGYLTAREIAKLKLNADLVTLSACDTASGEFVVGDGILGLSRAFFEAGANRVIASLWPVDDFATAELMKKFYYGLIVEQLSPAKALQQAKQFMVNSLDWGDPYYWAGFILQGDGRDWRGKRDT